MFTLLEHLLGLRNSERNEAKIEIYMYTLSDQTITTSKI